MKTIKEIRQAAVTAAAGSMSVPDTNLEMDEACAKAFRDAGGADPDDYEIFSRYWRAWRQTARGEELHVKQLGDRPSPSALKAEKAEKAAKAAPVAKPATAAAAAVLLGFLLLFSTPAQAQFIGSGMTVTNTVFAPITKTFQLQLSYSFVSQAAMAGTVTNVNTNDTYTFGLVPEPFGSVVTNTSPAFSLTTNISAATLVSLGQTNGSGVPTNGGTVIIQFPQITGQFTNSYWGMFSNSAWANLPASGGRTNGVEFSY